MVTDKQKAELRKLCVRPKEYYKNGTMSLCECILHIQMKWKEKYDNYSDSRRLWIVIWDRDKEEYVARYLMKKDRLGGNRYE